MTIATKAKAAYDTLQALHAAVGDTPEMVAHHKALNDLRRAFMPWDTFVATTGISPQAVPGSGGKDE